VLFAKLYAKSHVRADRWYKFGRTLLYGALEDETPFGSVRRFVEYEDYALRLLRDAGIPVPQPYGVIEITPEREYLILMEFFDGAVEIGEADVDDAVIESGLRIVRQFWTAGVAHRDIKPANLMVRDRRVLVIDVFFVQVRPSPWRQAVDLANMMLVLALGSDTQRVSQQARRFFSDAEIAEAFAATRGVAVPSQLRANLRTDGRPLSEEFTEMAPKRPPIMVQRWSARRVGLFVIVILAALVSLLVIQSNWTAFA
jgi:tRNA A-37 threonylcarbamoyl transferase component Bud32